MKINSRSPYYINHTVINSNIVNVRLNLWIYTGTQTTSRPVAPTYVLESTPINSELNFEISDLVKDYFVPSHTSTEILWVDYRIDEYEESSTTTTLNYFSGLFDGVGTSNENGIRLYYESDDTNGDNPKEGTIMYLDLNRTNPVTDSFVYYEEIAGDVGRIVRINQNASSTQRELGQIIEISYGDGYVTPENQRLIDSHSQTITTNTSQWNEGTNTVQLEGFYGYGYFEDGVNPQNDKPILLSSNYLLKLQGTDLKVPVNNRYGNFTGFGYSSDGLISNIYTQTSANNSSDVVKYAYEGDSTVRIEVNEETYYIETVKECKYNPYKVTFINKYGALEDVWFFKNNKIDLNLEAESFRRNIVSGGSYSLQDHQYHTLKKQGRETITLNSGFYPEGANETFRQLLLSDYAWITHEGNVLPIQIKDSSFNFKTRLTDRVINYTMQFEFAFDKINTVR